MGGLSQKHFAVFEKHILKFKQHYFFHFNNIIFLELYKNKKCVPVGDWSRDPEN